MNLDVRTISWNHPDSIELRSLQRAEVAHRYGTLDSEPGPAPTADDITVFFVAYDGPLAVACGGLRERDATEAEVKRMFVLPEHRGGGASVAILQRLEQFGREHGYARLVLETGDQQPDAVRFYDRQGYTRIPNFGYYVDSPHSLCFAKVL
ncbi:MAG: GNAT family N-acetyltransferase [Salinibacterium sp.]|nr:GNAT family N-acetyltransferase [Salinibacterium sp.]